MVGGALALAGALGGSAEAAPPVFFPLPGKPPSEVPPLQGTSNALPNIFRPPIVSRERIEVGLAPDGRVAHVSALQTLTLHQTADYRLAVPAPVLDVEPGLGSESIPGQQEGAVLWAGFAAGKRTLSARMRLEPSAGASSLPLRISAERQGDRFLLRLRNATELRTSIVAGDADRATLARLLDAFRRSPFSHTLGQGTYIRVRGRATPATISVAAPLLVSGTTGGGSSIRFLLGGGEPLERVVPVRRRAGFRITVRAVVPSGLLRPPGAATWAEAVRRDPRPDGRGLLSRAFRASLTLARVRQYQAFVANPDPTGPVSASYVYRFAPPRAIAAAGRGGSSSLGPGWIALIAAGALVAATGLVVLWAHA